MGVVWVAALRAENTRALVRVFGVAMTARAACGVVVIVFG
jgi:hypothetical protein